MTTTRDLDKKSEALVQSVAGVQAGKTFELFKSYVIANLAYPNYLDVNSHKVLRSVDGLREKFFVHSQPNKAEHFYSLCQELLQDPIFKEDGAADVPFAVLAFLFELANNPTGAEYDPGPQTVSMTQETVDDRIFIGQLESLREETRASSSGSDLSDWSDDDDAIEEESGHENASRFVRFVAIPHITGTGKGVCVRSLKMSNYSAGRSGMRHLMMQSKYGSTVADSFTGRSWLHENIQVPYWNRFCHSRIKLSPRRYFAGNLCRMWETCISEAGGDFPVVDGTVEFSERQIVLEILWMFRGNRESHVFEFGADHRCALNPKVKVSSMTKVALIEWLTPLTGKASTLQKLRHFIESVIEGLSSPPPTQTYKAYAAALTEWLCKLTVDVARLEKLFASQSETVSLSRLMKGLEPWLRKLVLLEKLHRSGIELCKADWPAWAKTAHLLTALYVTAVDVDISVGPPEESELFLSIFLKTMHPYLVIMDSWLSSCRLQDPHEEFILACNEGVSSLSETFWDEVVALREVPPSDRERLSASVEFLLPVLPVLVRIGKSVEILRRLDKFTDVIRHGSCDTLYQSVIEGFGSVAEGRGSSVNGESGLDARLRLHPDRTPDAGSRRRSPEGCSNISVDTYLEYLNCREIFDPILTCYFKKEYFDGGGADSGTDGVCSSSKEEETASVERSVRLFLTHARGHLPTLLEQAVIPVVVDKYNGICRRLVRVLSQEYRLEECLMNFRKYFLMEAGDVMFNFYSQLFDTIPPADLLAREVNLNLLLEDVVSAYSPSDAANLRISVDESASHAPGNPINSYDCVRLTYKISWPLDMVIDASCQKKYGEVFIFILQIKRAKYAVDELHFSELNAAAGGLESVSRTLDRERNRRLMYLFRMKLLNFVHCLHDYLMSHILQFTDSMCKDICERARDFQEVVDQHRLYLSIVYDHCLLHPPMAGIKTTITKILNLSLVFHNLWMSGIDRVTLDALKHIEDDLNVCCTFFERFTRYLAVKESSPYLESLVTSCCDAIRIPPS